METTRSEQQDYHHLSSSRCKPSSNQSSDYEDHELPSPTGRPTTEGAVNNKHRHKRSTQDKEGSRGKNNIPSASSAESIPSGSGSSTQVLKII